jgi:hypothetical protein
MQSFSVLTFLACIREVFGLNLAGYSAILTYGFAVILSHSRANADIVPRLGHERFLRNPFQFTQSELYSLAIESIIK